MHLAAGRVPIVMPDDDIMAGAGAHVQQSMLHCRRASIEAEQHMARMKISIVIGILLPVSTA
jgi:hypothetical protein